MTKDKTQEVIAAIISIQDHVSDGLGDCGCTQCQADVKTIEDNPKEAEAVAKLLAKTQSK